LLIVSNVLQLMLLIVAKGIINTVFLLSKGNILPYQKKRIHHIISTYSLLQIQIQVQVKIQIQVQIQIHVQVQEQVQVQVQV